jgi:hypothetical protein
MNPASSDFQNMGVSIYYVMYQESWEVQPKQIYSWSINDPASLGDDDANPKSQFTYSIDLSNAPEGAQQVEVTTTGGGYLSDSASYFTFEQTTSSTLAFSINSNSPPLETPFNSDSSAPQTTQTQSSLPMSEKLSSFALQLVLAVIIIVGLIGGFYVLRKVTARKVTK